MALVEYEFFGGPKDGDEAKIPSHVYELRVPLRGRAYEELLNEFSGTSSTQRQFHHLYAKGERITEYTTAAGALERRKQVGFLYLGIH